MSFFFDGLEVPLAEPGYAGWILLRHFGAGVKLPLRDEPPYLFCGNGACRDCNASVDGLSDLPSCRFPLAPGMSLRSGEGAGEENALSRNSRPPDPGEPLVADLVVVGAGSAGRAAFEEAASRGADVVLLEARRDAAPEARSCRPVAVKEGRLFVLESGRKRAVRARAVLFANGAHDAGASFPGSTLAGVLPLDLLERYVALKSLPGESLVVVGEAPEKVEDELRALGAVSVIRALDPRDLESVSGTLRVERARLRGIGDVRADGVFVRLRRHPSLELARAIGCSTLFDRARCHDRLVVGDDGATSVPGVFAAGDVVSAGSESDAAAGGGRAGRAAVNFLARGSVS